MEAIGLQTRKINPHPAAENREKAADDKGDALKVLSSYYEDSRLQATARPLDETMRSRYAAHFGQAAGKVKLYENPALQSIGEKGFAQGDEVHISSSVFHNPKEFQSVMDHEMTHIAQQNTGGARGEGLLLNAGLEQAADGGAGAMIGRSSLMDAAAAPMQGNLATNIFTRAVNKIRTTFDIGGYRTKKEAGRQAARNMFAATNDTFGDERRMVSLKAGLQDKFASRFTGGDEVSDAHAREEAMRLAEQHVTGQPNYHRALAGLDPQMQKYDNLQSLGPAKDDDEQAQRSNDSLKSLNIMEEQLGQTFDGTQDPDILALKQKIGGARKTQMDHMCSIPAYKAQLQALQTGISNIQLADDQHADEKGNHSNLDALRTAEKLLYNFQGKFMGAADDPAFKQLQDSIQSKYEDHYEQIKEKGWKFHAGVDLNQTDAEKAQTGVSDEAANTLWQNIVQGKGNFSLSDMQEVHKPGDGGRLESTQVGGFGKTARGHIGRLLSTRTGLDLISELSGAEQSSTLMPVRKNVSSSQSVAYAGPGAVPMVDSKGISTDSPHQGGFMPSATDKTRTVRGTGLQSQARISALDRDSSVRAVRTDGTQVLNPQFVLAGHEMMHALHNVKGINGKFRKVAAAESEKKGVLGTGTRWSNPEELATMFGKDLHYEDTDTLGESAEMQNDPALKRYVMDINEQKLRDEFGIKGRDYHNAGPAFRLQRH